MIKVEHIEVMNWEAAIRGMRNPMNSWDRSDTSFDCLIDGVSEFGIGANDLCLMQRLCSGGSVHRKFMRMIFVSMDITAPLYWWKEFDTYKVGTVANSCSTMHKIQSKEFTLDDFSHEHLNDDVIENPLKTVINCLNFFRGLYNQSHDKDDWWQMIQLLPSSYNQKRTVTFSYENVMEFIKWRRTHKLDEWCELVQILIDNLPYIKLLMEAENEQCESK